MFVGCAQISIKAQDECIDQSVRPYALFKKVHRRKECRRRNNSKNVSSINNERTKLKEVEEAKKQEEISALFHDEVASA